jgi:hypothetical protein
VLFSLSVLHLPSEHLRGNIPAFNASGKLLPELCFHFSGQKTVSSFLFGELPAGFPVFHSPEGFIRISTDSGLLRRYP